MIRQFLMKRAKIARGLINTYIRPKGQNYNDEEWWDDSFYINGISDRQTISSRKSPITAAYHYKSVELQILKHVYNNHIRMEKTSVLDIGSGSGHWIDFYKSLGACKTVGLDISRSSVNHLLGKYADQPDVRILHGRAFDLLNQLNESFGIVNAVGVMFHIVNDSEWSDTIKSIANVLPKDGWFIIGGHFGCFHGLNVQISANGQINKRLRSKNHWKKTLMNAGFSNIQVYSNNAYLWINDTLPENNILAAKKSR